jgi:hypothetical protein
METTPKTVRATWIRSGVTATQLPNRSAMALPASHTNKETKIIHSVLAFLITSLEVDCVEIL